MLWARVVGGFVVETYIPPTGKTIAQLFPPNLGWVDCTSTPGVVAGWTFDGLVFAAPAPPPPPAAPTLQQLAGLAVQAGVAITSTSTPALNATYAVDGGAQGRIAAVSTYILVNGKFPLGQTTLAWFDIAGVPHVFTTTAIFQAFGTVVADYVAALDLAAATNTGPLPPPSKTIP